MAFTEGVASWGYPIFVVGSVINFALVAGKMAWNGTSKADMFWKVTKTAVIVLTQSLAPSLTSILVMS